MPRAIQTLLYRSPFRPWVRSDRRLRLTGRRHVPTVEFLADCGFLTRRPDRYERSLRRRRFVRQALYWLSAFAAAWVAMESVHAMSMF